MYRQIRGWRHDYRNHIQTMKAYARSEDWEAIKRYLDACDQDLTTVDTVIKTATPWPTPSSLQDLPGPLQGHPGWWRTPVSR